MEQGYNNRNESLENELQLDEVQDQQTRTNLENRKKQLIQEAIHDSGKQREIENIEFEIKEIEDRAHLRWRAIHFPKSRAGELYQELKNNEIKLKRLSLTTARDEHRMEERQELIDRRSQLLLDKERLFRQQLHVEDTLGNNKKKPSEEQQKGKKDGSNIAYTSVYKNQELFADNSQETEGQALKNEVPNQVPNTENAIAKSSAQPEEGQTTVVGDPNVTRPVTEEKNLNQELVRDVLNAIEDLKKDRTIPEVPEDLPQEDPNTTRPMTEEEKNAINLDTSQMTRRVEIHNFEIEEIIDIPDFSGHETQQKGRVVGRDDTTGNFIVRVPSTETVGKDTSYFQLPPELPLELFVQPKVYDFKVGMKFRSFANWKKGELSQRFYSILGHSLKQSSLWSRIFNPANVDRGLRNKSYLKKNEDTDFDTWSITSESGDMFTIKNSRKKTLLVNARELKSMIFAEIEHQPDVQKIINNTSPGYETDPILYETGANSNEGEDIKEYKEQLIRMILKKRPLFHKDLPGLHRMIESNVRAILADNNPREIYTNINYNNTFLRAEAFKRLIKKDRLEEDPFKNLIVLSLVSNNQKPTNLVLKYNQLLQKTFGTKKANFSSEGQFSFIKSIVEQEFNMWFPGKESWNLQEKLKLSLQDKFDKLKDKVLSSSLRNLDADDQERPDGTATNLASDLGGREVVKAGVEYRPPDTALEKAITAI